MTIHNKEQVVYLIIVIVALLLSTGCSIIPLGTYANEGPIQNPPSPTRANIMDIPSSQYYGSQTCNYSPIKLEFFEISRKVLKRLIVHLLDQPKPLSHK